MNCWSFLNKFFNILQIFEEKCLRKRVVFPLTIKTSLPPKSGLKVLKKENGFWSLKEVEVKIYVYL